MTTKLWKKDKNFGIHEQVNIITWNVRGLANKENEIEAILNERKISIAFLSETKKKLHGTQDLGEYTIIYSGVEQNIRAQAGVAIMLHKSWKNRLTSYSWINERICTARFKIARGYLSCIAIYAPEEGRKEDNEKFYNDVQNILDRINKNDYIIIGGDYNARIGKEAIQDIIGHSGEQVINSNGRLLRDFALYNNFRIMNTFFQHKEIHKYTWAARETRTIIDYFLANHKTAKLFKDVRVYRGYEINTDHYLLQAKVNFKTRWYKPSRKQNSEQKEAYKIYLLKQQSIKELYQRRLEEKTKEVPKKNDIEDEWKQLKLILNTAAHEALGKKKIMKRRNKGPMIWTEELKTEVNNKKRLYLKYLQQQTNDSLIEYKRQAAVVKRLSRKMHKDRWDNFITEIENDVHGKQELSYKIIRHLNCTERDVANIKIIKHQQWLEYYKQLLTLEDKDNINEKEEINNRSGTNVDEIELEELEIALRNTKNRKATGSDKLNSELFKYASKNFKIRFLEFLNKCWIQRQIPEEWKMTIIQPIFKKGDKSKCENYRGISLLNAAYKIYSKIITERLKPISEAIIMEEQAGFRKGRSCIDNIFVLQQIIEKHKEFNRETHLTFIDYIKAFDRINRNELWRILYNRGIPLHLVEVIRNIYNNSKIQIAGDTQIRVEEVNLGLRQGCSMSPILFNIYMDEILRKWKIKIKNYTQNFNEDNFIMTMLFADDQVVIANNENNLQRAVHELWKINKNYNMEISVHKTKTMAFCGKSPVRSKIVIGNNIIEQVNKFKFLGVTLSYKGDYDQKEKIEKFNYINGTIRRTLKSKARKDTLLKFYKVMSVPSLLYGSETWVMKKRDASRLQTNEMKFLRSVAGYRKIEHKRNEEIREELEIYELNNKIEEYRNTWMSHISRMQEDRIPYKFWKYKPRGRRDIGRPAKRWMDQFQ